MSDLDNILSGVEAQAEAPEPVEQPEEQPEVAETPEEPPAEKPEEEPKDIPYAVFKSTREDLKSQLEATRRELEQIRKSQQPKQEAPKIPDVFEDQEGYTKTVLGSVEQRMMAQTLQTSRFFAEREFGQDEVKEAASLFDDPRHRAAYSEVMQSPSPFHAAVEYLRQQKAAAEIGPDPMAYKQKLEAEIRQKIEAELAAKQAKDMASKRAPSMANVNGSGGQRDPGWQGPVGLDQLIG
jgi:hypothetical protein